MIENDEQLDQSRNALRLLESALSALRRRTAGVNPDLFRAMAQTHLQDIGRIRSEIDDYIGINLADEARAPVWMALEGETLSGLDVSSHLLSEWLGRLRRSLQNVSYYLATHRLLETGRPDRKLLDATDPHIVALSHGSVKIGLRLPSTFIQGNFFQDERTGEPPSAQRAIERMLEMAIWAQSNQTELPVQIFPDNDEAAILASQLMNIVPSGRGIVKSVKFSGALVPSIEPVRLYSKTRPRLIRLIQDLTVVTEETVEGVIREIDLDAQRIILRERGPGNPDLKCYLPDDLVDRAESLIDQMVRVRGTISSASPDMVEVISLELLGAT
jgi:hypothetical protein